MTWVVKTNTNQCLIYQYQKKPASLILIKEISHPENRVKTGDYFTADKPGHFQSSSPDAHGSFVQRTDPKEAAIDDFAREIARELNLGRNTQAYEKLIIISAPHMNGLLLKHFDKHVKELITHNIQKDLQHLTDKELLAYLHEHTQFQNQTV